MWIRLYNQPCKNITNSLYNLQHLRNSASTCQLVHCHGAYNMHQKDSYQYMNLGDKGLPTLLIHHDPYYEYYSKSINTSLRPVNYNTRPGITINNSSIKLDLVTFYVPNPRDLHSTGYVRCIPRHIPTSPDDSVQQSSDVAPDPAPKPPKKYNEKMQKTYEILHAHLPKLFTEPHPLNIYHDAMVFENNIKGFTINGKTKYILWLYWLRISSHFKYAKIQFNVLKMTIHEDTHQIKIRWQMKGVSNTSAFFKLWKLNNRYDVVRDGFSTLILNSDGLVIRHIMDKMMPDEDNKAAPLLKSNVFSAKLALLIGLLIPQLSADD